MSRDTAFNGETTPRHTIIYSDSQCLPPGDPKILCAKHEYPVTGKSFIVSVFPCLFQSTFFSKIKTRNECELGFDSLGVQNINNISKREVVGYTQTKLCDEKL